MTLLTRPIAALGNRVLRATELLGGMGWAAKNLDADVTPNLEKTTPGYREIQPEK